MSTAILRKKGQFTIPADIRERLGMDENEILQIATVGNRAMIVIPGKLKTPSILKKTSALAKKKGISLEEMMHEIDEIRKHA